MVLTACGLYTFVQCPNHFVIANPDKTAYLSEMPLEPWMIDTELNLAVTWLFGLGLSDLKIPNTKQNIWPFAITDSARSQVTAAINPSHDGLPPCEQLTYDEGFDCGVRRLTR